ncbi:MAG: hypothetical protein KGJ57_14645 [Sphingomonadales bacterium]|nr:hypothetical protein [Sphingomonadales bacterium]MDE2170642.1 hypothetical protein [Sphingomonadales bacterium]
MRRLLAHGWAVILVMAACACHHRDDFDERYQKQSDQAVAAASSMEEELQTRLDASSAAGHGVAAQAAPTVP